MSDAELMAVLNERDRLRAEVDGLKQAYTEATGRMSGLIGYAVKECESLRAELAEVRRLLLPHPDAKAGEDAGCGCDMHTAVTAAAWAAGEMRRMRAELAEQKQLNLQLAERLAACSQVLGRAAERGKVCGCNLDTKPTA